MGRCERPPPGDAHAWVCWFCSDGSRAGALRLQGTATGPAPTAEMLQRFGLYTDRDRVLAALRADRRGAFEASDRPDRPLGMVSE